MSIPDDAAWQQAAQQQAARSTAGDALPADLGRGVGGVVAEPLDRSRSR